MAGIFLLELGQNGHFDFQNEAKVLERQVFVAINIPCKFDEDIFINEWDVKVYVNLMHRLIHKQTHV